MTYAFQVGSFVDFEVCVLSCGDDILGLSSSLVVGVVGFFLYFFVGRGIYKGALGVPSRSQLFHQYRECNVDGREVEVLR